MSNNQLQDAGEDVHTLIHMTDEYVMLMSGCLCFRHSEDEITKAIANLEKLKAKAEEARKFVRGVK